MDGTAYEPGASAGGAKAVGEKPACGFEGASPRSSLLGAMLDLCPLETLAVDGNGIVLEMNAPLAGSSEWRGRCLWDLFPKPMAELLNSASGRVLSSSKGGLLTVEASLEGEPLSLEIALSPLPGGAGNGGDAVVAMSKRIKVASGRAPASLRSPRLEIASSFWSEGDPASALVASSPAGGDEGLDERVFFNQREREAIGDGLKGVLVESLSKDMRLLWANREASIVSGKPLSEMKGQLCYEAMRRRSAPCDDCTAVKALSSSQPQEGELKSPDGRRYKSRSLPVRDKSGKVSGVVHVAMDITEWRNLEERMRQARIKAEELSRAKGEFLSCVSHEIRTPMNVIVGMSDLLRDAAGPASKEIAEYCTEIGRASEMLLSILNDILDYSLLESGDVKLFRQPFALREEFCSVAADMRRRAAEKGLEFALELDERLPWTVVGDPRHLRRILLNLVGNAVKFTEKGRVRVFAWAEDVTPGSVIWLKFKVSDTGIGISNEASGHLFEPFTQEDSSNKRQYGGTGLGLAIVRKLLDVMGGAIEMRSRKGEGTVFSVSIPFELSIPSGVAGFDSSDASAFHAPLSFPGLKALLLDASPSSSLMRRILAALSVDCKGAASPEEASALLAKGGFDILFLDMSDSTPGSEALAASLKGSGFNARPLPVIALAPFASGRGWDAEESSLRKKAGIDVFLPVPPRKSQVAGAIKALCHLEG